MFLPSDAIWKFCQAGDELDDWLPYAEGLVEKWSNQSRDEVEFSSTFELIIAAYLLEDNLLPAQARSAFARVMLETIGEVDEAKISVKCLHIEPPKPGRKQIDRTAFFFRMREVMSLIESGMTTTEAYKVVAEKSFKSPDTIRRDYERLTKKKRMKKEAGENSK